MLRNKETEEKQKGNTCNPLYLSHSIKNCFFVSSNMYARAQGGKMGLFDDISAEVMISQETQETGETRPKSLEKIRNRMGFSEETGETRPKSLDFPAFTRDDWDTFQCAFDCLVARGFWFKHWDSIGNFLKRTLPGELFEQLRREVDR